MSVYWKDFHVGTGGVFDQKKTDPNSVRPQRMVNRVEGTES